MFKALAALILAFNLTLPNPLSASDGEMKCLMASKSGYGGDKAHFGSRQPAFIFIQNEPKTTLGRSSFSRNYETLRALIKQAAADQKVAADQKYLLNVAAVLDLDLQALQSQANSEASQLRDQNCTHNLFGADFALVRNTPSDFFFDPKTFYNSITLKMEVCRQKENPTIGSQNSFVEVPIKLEPPAIHNKSGFVNGVADPLKFFASNFTEVNPLHYLASSNPAAWFMVYTKIFDPLEAHFPRADYYYVFYFKGAGDEDRLFAPDYTVDFSPVSAKELSATLLGSKFAEVTDDVAELVKVDALASSFGEIRVAADLIKTLLNKSYSKYPLIGPPKVLTPQNLHSTIEKGKVLRLLDSQFGGGDLSKSALVPLIVFDTPKSGLELALSDTDLTSSVTADSYEELSMEFAGKICTRKGNPSSYQTLDFEHLLSPLGVDGKNTSFAEYLEKRIVKIK